MLLKNIEVAIIGAGPVGLTMARLLQLKGVAVTVYERDKDAHTRIWGGTLDLHKGTGQDAMKAAGLLEQYYALARPMGRTVADEHGNVLFSQKLTPAEQYDNPEINRNDLRRLLLDSLTNDALVWDRKLVGLEEQNGKWVLHFEDKPDAIADFVIGANGGMSKARQYITDAIVEYTGTYIIQGEVPRPERNCLEFYQLCDDNILMSASQGNLLVANPKNNSALSYSVIFKMPDEWKHGNGLNVLDTNSIRRFLTERFSHWHECYNQLFRATSFFVGLPTRKIPLDIPWKTNRPLPITLIGDAAHVMPPFAGQGANIGLLDALILSENLTNGKFDSIESAINDYEQKMVVYATEAQLETSQNELQMLRPDFSFLQFID
jgi:tetracycline resistance monooxygenase